MSCQRVHGLAPVVRERDPKGALLEFHLDDAANVGLVVSDKDVPRRGWIRHRSNERCDGFSIATQLAKELGDVGVKAEHHQQERVWADDADDDEAV